MLGENPVPVTLSTTNRTWSDLETNPGLHVERPATNHHGCATEVMNI